MADFESRCAAQGEVGRSRSMRERRGEPGRVGGWRGFPKERATPSLLELVEASYLVGPQVMQSQPAKPEKYARA